MSQNQQHGSSSYSGGDKGSHDYSSHGDHGDKHSGYDYGSSSKEHHGDYKYGGDDCGEHHHPYHPGCGDSDGCYHPTSGCGSWDGCHEPSGGCGYEPPCGGYEPPVFEPYHG